VVLARRFGKVAFWQEAVGEWVWPLNIIIILYRLRPKICEMEGGC
jgi:hypothetical protein